MLKKILIATDTTEHSRKAIEKGIALAKQVGAKVGIVYALDPTPSVGAVYDGVFTEENWQIHRKDARDLLEKTVREYDCETEIFIPTGNPKQEILEAAKDFHADLVVTGTHGRTGLNHMMMGSIAEYIMRHSHVPVMVVKN